MQAHSLSHILHNLGPCRQNLLYGNKMGLLLAKFAQSLIDISVIPGNHFKFRPLEKKC